MKGRQSLAKVVKLQGTVVQEGWKHSVSTEGNLIVEILHFQIKLSAIFKKKVCLAGTLPETTEIKSGERWLQKVKILLKIPWFYPSGLEAHSLFQRTPIWKALLTLKQKDLNLSVFSSACNYGQISTWTVEPKPLNA